MASRINESSGNGPCTQPETRPNMDSLDPQLEKEGCPVMEESGTVCGETRTLRIFQEFRQIYDDCLKKMENSKEENLALRKLSPFRKLVEDLWEQNTMLVETVEELEQEATCRVSVLQNKLDKCNEKDLENLIQKKDREINCLSEEISEKNELLGKYCRQLDELRREMTSRSQKHQQFLHCIKEAALPRLGTVPEDLNVVGDELNENSIEILLSALWRETDQQKIKFGQRIEETECLLKDVSVEKNRIINEKTDLCRKLECLEQENRNLKCELSELKNLRMKNEELSNTLEQIKDERDQLLRKVNCLHRSMKELDTSLKETRWALTTEIAEKHDTILELRRNVACLEEQVHQANMKAFMKDDAVREKRKEMKISRPTGRCGNQDAVTEVTRPSENKVKSESEGNNRKMIRFVNSPSYGSSCDDLDDISFSATHNNEYLNEDNCYKDMTPQGRLEGLKQSLRVKIQKMQAQDVMIQELECQLTKAKEDLACLKEKCDGVDRQSPELTEYERKLKQFRRNLLCATIHLENTLQNMAGCQTCKECRCKTLMDEKGSAIMKIKRDLESLEIKNSEAECKTANEMEREKPGSNQRFGEKGGKRMQPLTIGDVNNFRIQAVTGVAALEDMKAQIDILYELLKMYYRKLPCDYENSKIEECENKFNKHHAEFEEVIDNVYALLESFSSEKSHKSDSSCSDEKKLDSSLILKTSIKEKQDELHAEQTLLQKEITDQQIQLQKLRDDLKEVEMELNEKRCQTAEQEKDLQMREKEISRLREGVRSFRERLKEMQVDITENLNDCTKPIPLSESGTSLSVLSCELQELYEILTDSQTSLPGMIEKCKEENRKMAEKISCLEKCLENKEETSSLLQKALKLRDSQLQDLNTHVQCLTLELKKLKQETKDKIRMICNLQDSLKTKEFQNRSVFTSENEIKFLMKCELLQEELQWIKIKDDNIDALQFEICDLDWKLKAMEKEAVKKGKEVEDLQDEILYVSSKNFFLNREIDLLEPKLGKMQKKIILYEDMVGYLQNELRNRECEAEDCYMKVEGLEQEMENEMKNCEKKLREDSECIRNMGMVIEHLENELRFAKLNMKETTLDKRSRREDKSSDIEESEKEQEASRKLKDAENQLRQKRIEFNKETKLPNRLGVYDDDDEEDEDDEDGQIEDILVAKTGECSDSAREVQYHQEKLEKVQSQCLPEQVDKDSELLRLKQEVSRMESEFEPIERENAKLRCDIKTIENELKNQMKAADCYKEELLKMEEELRNARSEKDTLLKYIEDLQQKIEELCMKNTEKENEYRTLFDECEKQKKELNNEICRAQRDYNALNAQCNEIIDKYRSSKKKIQNLEKLNCRVNEDNEKLQKLKCSLEKDLCQFETENLIMKEKIESSKEQMGAEIKKLMAENFAITQENKLLCTRNKELIRKVKALEDTVMQHKSEIISNERRIKSYKMELDEANLSSQRMRDESLRVTECTKRYLAAQRRANEGVAMAECSKDVRHYMINEERALDDQMKAVIHLNEQFELQNEKNDYQDAEPRSYSPLPWGCSNVERDSSSPEYLESGFQSMQQSPTNMNYMDFSPDMRRTQSQYNSNVGSRMTNDYSPCRSNSIR